jgi:hypothetical protein
VSSTCTPQLNLVTVKFEVACSSETSEENFLCYPVCEPKTQIVNNSNNTVA